MINPRYSKTYDRDLWKYRYTEISKRVAQETGHERDCDCTVCSVKRGKYLSEKRS